MLSVCITVYNLEEYIDETLQSVFNQKTHHEIEVLIGDDGSNDGTMDRVRKWEKKYPGIIRSYSMSRESQRKYNSITRASFNRINLLRHAKGEYITFLDGDDFYKDENFYEKAINILEDPANSDCVLCCGSTELYYPNGVTRCLLKNSWIPGKMRGYDYWEKHYTAAEAAIIRNTFKVPIGYEGVFDDNLIIFFALQSGNNIYCLPNSVIYYRQKMEGNFLKRPMMEKSLYSLCDLEVELTSAPKFWKASLARHQEELCYVKKFSREIIKARYLEIYKYAKQLKLSSILDIFEQVHNEKKERKIKIVFLIYRPAVWLSLKSIYDEMMKDERFEVIIVPIPIKKILPDGTEKYVSEGAEEFFADFNCQVINGYNYCDDLWLDLHNLMPDYVFYAQPYNISLPKVYNSSTVSQYTNICFIPYCFIINSEDVEKSILNIDFLKDTYLFFSDFPHRKLWLENKGRCIGKLKRENIHYCGFTRLDNLGQYKQGHGAWRLERKTHKRILWLPRWTTNEENCNFFRYKNNIIDYAIRNSDSVEIVFRPHPQMWKEFAYTGEMSEQEQTEYRRKIDMIENISIDESGMYIETLYSSDVLIADCTTLLIEYMLTGKPIIYCHYKRDTFNYIGEELYRGFYVADDWNEVRAYLDMIMGGWDPLAERRKKICNKLLPTSDDKAGRLIKEVIKKDFLNG